LNYCRIGSYPRLTIENILLLISILLEIPGVRIYSMVEVGKDVWDLHIIPLQEFADEAEVE
jgi:hypothetical protein